MNDPRRTAMILELAALESRYSTLQKDPDSAIPAQWTLQEIEAAFARETKPTKRKP